MKTMDTAEPEWITIVEGPPPEFRPVPDLWPLSVYEDPHPHRVAVCQMRRRMDALSGPTRVVSRSPVASMSLQSDDIVTLSVGPVVMS